MNFKKQVEGKYNHIGYFNDEGKITRILLGVNKESDLDDNNEFDEALLTSIAEPDFYLKLFQLSPRDSQIVMNYHKKLIEDENKKRKFSSLYFDIVLDFIFHFSMKTLYDISKDMNYNGPASSDQAVYDNLSKPSQNSSVARFETVQDICNLYGITSDIVVSGTGTCYTPAGSFIYSHSSLYNIETIRQYKKEHPNWDLKTMICDLLHLSDSEIEEYPLYMAVTDNSLLNSKHIYLLNQLIETMNEV